MLFWLLIMLYRIIVVISAPVWLGLFAWRIYKKKEHPTRWRERLGMATLARPAGTVYWLHGASVGETLSALPVIKRLLVADPECAIVLTSTTQTSAKLMAKRLPELSSDRCFHQFNPLDNFISIWLFLRHWQPKKTVLIESELWPELLAQAPKPYLVGARISDRSAKRYLKLGTISRTLLNRLQHIHAQTEQDLERLEILGLGQVTLGGNLKFDAEPLPDQLQVREELQLKFGPRPIILASSTHADEEIQIAALYPKLLEIAENPLLIILPRHPERGLGIMNQLMQLPYNYAVRSRQDSVDVGTQIYLADTLGELGLFYRLAHVTLMGGSFIPHGGHNPIEPLQLGTPVICGPHMHNFRIMLQQLDAALIHVDGYTAIPAAIQPHLQNTPRSQFAARPELAKLTGASDRAVALITNK